MKNVFLTFFFLTHSSTLFSYKVGAVIPFFYYQHTCYLVLRPITNTIISSNNEQKTKTFCESFNWCTKKEKNLTHWEIAQKGFYYYLEQSNYPIKIILEEKNNIRFLEYTEKHYILFFNEITKIEDIHFFISLKELQSDKIRIVPLSVVQEGIKQAKGVFPALSSVPSSVEEIEFIPTVENYTWEKLEEFRINLNDISYPVLLAQFLLSPDKNMDNVIEGIFETLGEKQTTILSPLLPPLKTTPLTPSLLKASSLPPKKQFKNHSLRVQNLKKLSPSTKQLSLEELHSKPFERENEGKQEDILPFSQATPRPRLSQIFSPEVRKELEQKIKEKEKSSDTE